MKRASGAYPATWRAASTVLSTRYSVLSIWMRLSALFVVVLAMVPEAPSQETSHPAVSGTLLAPKAFRAAAATIQPSLVRIEGFGGLAATGSGGGYQSPGEGPTTGLIV